MKTKVDFENYEQASDYDKFVRQTCDAHAKSVLLAKTKADEEARYSQIAEIIDAKFDAPNAHEDVSEYFRSFSSAQWDQVK